MRANVKVRLNATSGYVTLVVRRISPRDVLQGMGPGGGGVAGGSGEGSTAVQ